MAVLSLQQQASQRFNSKQLDTKKHNPGAPALPLYRTSRWCGMKPRDLNAYAAARQGESVSGKMCWKSKHRCTTPLIRHRMLIPCLNNEQSIHTSVLVNSSSFQLSAYRLRHGANPVIPAVMPSNRASLSFVMVVAVTPRLLRSFTMQPTQAIVQTHSPSVA